MWKAVFCIPRLPAWHTATRLLVQLRGSTAVRTGQPSALSRLTVSRRPSWRVSDRCFIVPAEALLMDRRSCGWLYLTPVLDEGSGTCMEATVSVAVLYPPDNAQFSCPNLHPSPSQCSPASGKVLLGRYYQLTRSL